MPETTTTKVGFFITGDRIIFLFKNVTEIMIPQLSNRPTMLVVEGTRNTEPGSDSIKIRLLHLKLCICALRDISLHEELPHMNVKKLRFRHQLTANDTSKTAKITKK